MMIDMYVGFAITLCIILVIVACVFAYGFARMRKLYRAEQRLAQMHKAQADYVASVNTELYEDSLAMLKLLYCMSLGNEQDIVHRASIMRSTLYLLGANNGTFDYHVGMVQSLCDVPDTDKLTKMVSDIIDSTCNYAGTEGDTFDRNTISSLKLFTLMMCGLHDATNIHREEMDTATNELLCDPVYEEKRHRARMAKQEPVTV